MFIGWMLCQGNEALNESCVLSRKPWMRVVYKMRSNIACLSSPLTSQACSFDVSGLYQIFLLAVSGNGSYSDWDKTEILRN